MAGDREVLAGRYELREVLGRGGMGVVYRARDRVLDRVVAVKVLPLDRAQDPTAVARFEREALAAAGLNHRNIVAVYDFGADDETRFIVMEHLTGQSLAQRLRERGAMPVIEAAGIVEQIGSALAAAHMAGIVHRDIKPANVMVDEQGHVKVLDFGIARLTGGVTLTQTATVVGSAAYLAPELCRGVPADGRSDIYALGCVLFELLTGEPPFTGELPAAVVHQQISVAPRNPGELNRAVPPELGALCLAMLAKDPSERPQHAAELVAALRGVDSEPAASVATSKLPIEEPATAELAADAAGTAQMTAEATRVMPARSAGRPPEGRRQLALAGAVAVALVIAVLALAPGSGAPSPTAAKQRHAGTQTGSTHATTTTPTQNTATLQNTATVQTAASVATPTAPAQLPHAAGPPVPHKGAPHGAGPHGRGPRDGAPPPGQAKKLGGPGSRR